VHIAVSLGMYAQAGEGRVDEVFGALVRGVFWLVGQAVRFVVEAVAGDILESGARAGRRRFVAWRSRRRGGARPERVRLDKGTPGG